jgi:hypothetical protein
VKNGGEKKIIMRHSLSLSISPAGRGYHDAIRRLRAVMEVGGQFFKTLNLLKAYKVLFQCQKETFENQHFKPTHFKSPSLEFKFKFRNLNAELESARCWAHYGHKASIQKQFLHKIMISCSTLEVCKYGVQAAAFKLRQPGPAGPRPRHPMMRGRDPLGNCSSCDVMTLRTAVELTAVTRTTRRP